MGVNIGDVAETYAKKERARKRFQDKQTRKALVAFVASGTHREVVVKKSEKVKPGKFVTNFDWIIFTNLVLSAINYHALNSKRTP